MKHPKVSVVIPSYNYAHFLDDAITSVLEQTFTDFELIIVDNNSTDNTDEIVRKYLQDKRVCYHKNEANVGLVKNWNRCLDYATGEYIKFLCADDKLHPRILEKFVEVMDKYPNVSIVSSYNQMFGRSNKRREKPFQGLVKGNVAKESLIGKPNWLFSPTSNMFRRESIKDSRFHAQLHVLIDLEFYIRLLSVGDCYVVPEFLAYSRSHPGTVSAMNAKKYNHTFEGYRLLSIVRAANAKADQSFQSLVNKELKKRAIRCVTIMYKVLPKLHKKENRKLFKESFQIGYSEGVHFQTITHYVNWKRIVFSFCKLSNKLLPSRKVHDLA